MPVQKIFLLGFVMVLALTGCSTGNEETIDVQEPAGVTKIDLMTGEQYSTRDYDNLIRQGDDFTSSNSIELYPLEDYAADAEPVNTIESVPVYQSRIPTRSSFKRIGNSSIEISDIGQPAIEHNTTYETSMNNVGLTPMLNAPQNRNFVNIAAPGEDVVRIYFDYGSSELNAEAADKVIAVSQKFNPNHGIALSIEGHASQRSEIQDPIVRKKANLKMSMERSYAVARALIEAGVPANSLKVVSWGEEHPAAPVAGMDQDSASRRVEIIPVSGQ